jgi:tetratricopeptide (TPR) repeat protein
MLLTARKFDDSISYSQRALELEPGLLAPRINLAEAYLEKKMFPEAIRELEKVPDTDDDYVVAEKAYTYAIAGRKDEALKAFTELQKSVGTRGAPYAYARIYSALGDKDKAFEWLEKINLNRMMQASLKYDSQMDRLRPDPRFNEFLKRHKLEHLLQE